MPTGADPVLRRHGGGVPGKLGHAKQLRTQRGLTLAGRQPLRRQAPHVA